MADGRQAMGFLLVTFGFLFISVTPVHGQCVGEEDPFCNMVHGFMNRSEDYRRAVMSYLNLKPIRYDKGKCEEGTKYCWIGCPLNGHYCIPEDPEDFMMPFLLMTAKLVLTTPKAETQTYDVLTPVSTVVTFEFDVILVAGNPICTAKLLWIKKRAVYEKVQEITSLKVFGRTHVKNRSFMEVKAVVDDDGETYQFHKDTLNDGLTKMGETVFDSPGCEPGYFHALFFCDVDPKEGKDVIVIHSKARKPPLFQKIKESCGSLDPTFNFVIPENIQTVQMKDWKTLDVTGTNGLLNFFKLFKFSGTGNLSGVDGKIIAAVGLGDQLVFTAVITAENLVLPADGTQVYESGKFLGSPDSIFEAHEFCWNNSFPKNPQTMDLNLVTGRKTYKMRISVVVTAPQDWIVPEDLQPTFIQSVHPLLNNEGKQIAAVMLTCSNGEVNARRISSVYVPGQGLVMTFKRDKVKEILIESVLLKLAEHIEEGKDCKKEETDLTPACLNLLNSYSPSEPTMNTFPTIPEACKPWFDQYGAEAGITAKDDPELDRKMNIMEVWKEIAIRISNNQVNGSSEEAALANKRKCVIDKFHELRNKEKAAGEQLKDKRQMTKRKPFGMRSSGMGSLSMHCGGPPYGVRPMDDFTWPPEDLYDVDDVDRMMPEEMYKSIAEYGGGRMGVYGNGGGGDMYYSETGDKMYYSGTGGDSGVRPEKGGDSPGPIGEGDMSASRSDSNEEDDYDHDDSAKSYAEGSGMGRRQMPDKMGKKGGRTGKQGTREAEGFYLYNPTTKTIYYIFCTKASDKCIYKVILKLKCQDGTCKTS